MNIVDDGVRDISATGPKDKKSRWFDNSDVKKTTTRLWVDHLIVILGYSTGLVSSGQSNACYLGRPQSSSILKIFCFEIAKFQPV
jgi:hypothetical protein